MMQVKHVLYAHSKLRPLVVLLSELVQGFLRRLLVRTGVLPKLTPACRQFLLMMVWFLGLLLQALMLWLLGELITLCISLYELWAMLAGDYVAREA